MDITGFALQEVISTGLPHRLVAELLPRLVKSNFLVFLKIEMGMEIARPQKEWWDVIKGQEDTVILAPRDHGKSHTIIRGYAAWKAKYDPFVKEILILGADASASIENLDKFKGMLQESPSLRDLLPVDRKNFNTRAEIRLTNGVTLKAKAFFSRLRGRHPQLILLDDVVNEHNSSSEDNRKKVKDYFWAVVYPMKDKGTEALVAQGYKAQIVIVGTAQNEEDLYHELLNNPMFKGVRQSALVNITDKETLWPERYSWDDLMRIKGAMGTLQFAKEYCNEPITEETSLFPPSLFTSMFDRNRSYILDYDGENQVYLGADFSVPGELGGDYTVVTVAEKIAGDKMVLLSIWRDKPESMARQVEKIAEMTKRFKVTQGLLESNLFQKVYAEHFRKYTNLPLKGHNVTHSGKNSYDSGVLSFRPIFENQKFVFPYKTESDREMTDMLVREFAGMVRKDGKLGNFRFHDDMVMSLWHTLTASRQATFSYSF